MDIKNIVILISVCINIFFGVLVFVKGKNSFINKIFSLLAISVSWWGVGMILYRQSLTVENSIFWCKFLYVAPIFIVYTFLIFTIVFPQNKIKFRTALLLFLGSLLASYLTFFTKGIVKDVVFHPGQEKQIIFGKLYILYAAYISLYFTISYLVLAKKYFKNNGLIRTQILYIFLGTFISSILGMFTNLLLPTFNIFVFNWVGQIVSLMMVVMIALAVVKYQLMDIRFILRKSIVYISSITTLLIIAIVLKYLVSQITPFFSAWVDILILIGALAVYPKLQEYYFVLANKYFFASVYDSRKVIAGLIEKLRSTIELPKIYSYLSEIINSAFHVKAIAVLSLDEASKDYYVKYNAGFTIVEDDRFPIVEELDRYINAAQPIVMDEFRKSSYDRKHRIVDMLKKYGIAVIVPLVVKNDVIGLIVLGEKESNEAFNKEDIEVLSIIAAQTSITMDNAIMYEELRRWNIKLEEEVKKATTDLQAANEQLKKLDAAKSEFISIASHQLRTPLTIIKGYVSMLLENNFGDLLPAIKDPLTKVFVSNERLIRLVENLLNISRIESGRIQYNIDPTDLVPIAASVVEELQPNAVRKKLSLLHENKVANSPEVLVNADKDKIREVMMNLTDNAIKYSREGSVKVTTSLVDGNLRFCVQDTGIGISEKNMQLLFKKFSRVQGTSVLHTEGTGLGLYVAKQIVEYQHGRIWAESDGEGKGSRFIFELPVIK